MDHQLITAAEVHATCRARQGERCGACWEPLGSQAEAHHRQSRRITKGWCTCWTVLLHPRCHTQGTAAAPAVHDRPAWARGLGLIVPSWDDPRTTLLTIRYPWVDEAVLTCDGMVASPAAPVP